MFNIEGCELIKLLKISTEIFIRLHVENINVPVFTTYNLWTLHHDSQHVYSHNLHFIRIDPSNLYNSENLFIFIPQSWKF